jgi:hypothetical protein
VWRARLIISTAELAEAALVAPDRCALLHLNPTQTMRRTYDLWFKRLPEAWWPYVPQPLKESNFSEVIFFVFTIGCAGGGMAKLFSTPTPKIIRDDDTRR